MKIAVLNGSPKGEYSITLQYIHYVQRKMPAHTFEVYPISSLINSFEKDCEAFDHFLNDILDCDGILWSFGVFVMVVPSQYMRFIELIFERGKQDVFKDKYAAVLTTSIHYFDHTAHSYMRAVCEDLAMQYVDGLSLDISDLSNEKARQTLVRFIEIFTEEINARAHTSKMFPPITRNDFVYMPGENVTRISTNGKKILVITDNSDMKSNLGKMIDRFRQAYTEEIELINLHDIDIRGGCLGCMRCGYDNMCVQKDGFRELYNNRVRTADIIVFAGIIKGRYLSSMWKTFYDRAFFWNHTPSLTGKQVGYLISGHLSQCPYLPDILNTASIFREANHADTITDEVQDSAAIDHQLDTFAGRLVKFSEKEYVRPHNFLAVGGQKIFRDDIWGRIRVVWQADHRYFKTHGKYDFPQKDIKNRILNFFILTMCKNSTFRKKFYEKVRKVPVKKLERIVNKNS